MFTVDVKQQCNNNNNNLWNQDRRSSELMSVNHSARSIGIIGILHGPSVLPDKAKSVVCSIVGLALSFWMKHLVIGQLQKPAKFLAFYWSTSRSQAFIGQLLGTNRVKHLPKRTVMVLFTISDA